MISILDAHIHPHHQPKFNYPEKWTYIACSACPDDWMELQEISSTTLPYYGIHPQCQENNRTDSNLKQLEELLINDPRAGLGEIGIDRRFYSTFSKQKQIELFKIQIRLAIKWNRPIVIHQVHTIGTISEIIRELKPSVPIIIHGWRGTTEMAHQLIALGCHLSLGPGNHWENEKFTSMIRKLPLNKILLESDWPYSKGHINDYEKVMVALYWQLADTRGIDRTEIIDIVRTNGTVFTNR